MVEASHANAKISLEELTEKFGPAAHVAPYGDCLIVDGKEFNPDWEAELADQGYRCYESSVSGRAVTLIKLARAVPPGKTVYVPPKAADPPAKAPPDLLQEYDRLVAESGTYGVYKTLSELPKFKSRSASGIQQKVKRLVRKRKKATPAAASETPTVESGSKAGSGFWTEQEKTLLLSEYNRIVAEQGRRYGAIQVLMESGKFPGRSDKAINIKIKELLRQQKTAAADAHIEKTIQETKKKLDLPAAASKETPKIIGVAVADSVNEKGELVPGGLQEPQEKYEATNKGLAIALDLLVGQVNQLKKELEANTGTVDALESAVIEINKKVDEAKAEFEEKILKLATSIADCPTTEDFQTFRNLLAKHLHSEKTGETTIPMEAAL